MMQWWGPKGHTPTEIETDVRVGGRFHAVMFGDGERHEVNGTYKEVVPNRKLVFSWAWISTPERESQVTISLKADGEATWLTLTHEQFFDEAARDGHNFGWTGALDKLEALYA
ncbi:MAG: SRPBCC domain-containing protein [Parvibaculum sp.]|uniref:SRPBCC family protein n=1 Tax=Parvibaculum sp. TaxID=2024848 RepID=UPI0025FAE0ED|nr:SRPBCC domain-containing protein [Parvibaculum sp.]MCE9649916.1 SRPBCC domain-containing protein [Parvibaculum sp.]